MKTEACVTILAGTVGMDGYLRVRFAASPDREFILSVPEPIEANSGDRVVITVSVSPPEVVATTKKPDPDPEGTKRRTEILKARALLESGMTHTEVAKKLNEG